MVEGIVLMRRGAQSVPTIKRVEAKVDEVNSSGVLPPGVRSERIYDRSDLIAITTRTVLHNMVVGVLLIFVLQWLFLGNPRSALIVGMTVPFALSFAIGLMVLRGESANLLSVGAIDFGLIVDATVIMVENIYRHVEDGLPPFEAALKGSQEIGFTVWSISLSLIAVFIPLLLMGGIIGRVFREFALTVTAAILVSCVVSLTLAPMLCSSFMKRGSDEHGRLYRAIENGFGAL